MEHGAWSMEQGAWSKEQGARSKEQGARSNEQATEAAAPDRRRLMVRNTNCYIFYSY